ncbi:dual specificity protein kinase splA isoform X2 [Sabethes cyaneus]|uniref:dual specificity protein kinase splA isoform X2 n=1 Tax=Sabethes cyaneus TaxID=53552 RepID=UPI00237EA178|nr:dual specificity protein kinase splA isoform X2 [Sabethes cyaneus]
MDIGIERNEGGATIGTLFQHIVNDMKNSSPLWDDFIAKATKLHACLRAAIQALAAYLEAFQKIADAATNSKGATKEIGTALTRVCLRHKAVENRMKTFTAAIMDCLIVPLQEKLEDWRKHVAVIDKDHAKEYKRCRAELKKRSSDTLRLQKKAKKGQADNLHILVESSMQDVTLRRSELEEVERKSLRAIMVEERSRYCAFVNMLQPVVHEECEVMSELSHLQEAMQLIAIVTKDPSILPQASEELILESKTNINLYPDSPGGSNSQGGCSNSLGSRKSSVCSISSMNSSSSGSPGHQFQRSLSQYSPAIRLKPGESSDSGFCSSPALTSQASTLASQSHAVSTWPPHTQEGATSVDRPHTISSAYEKGHQRPALTVYTFQNPETISENQKSPANIACRPPLPVRCSSLERPLSTASIKNSNPNVPRQCPSPIPAHITKEHPQLQPTYVNMTELASMAATKVTNNHNNNATNQSPSSAQTPLQPQAVGYQQLQQPNSPVLSSASSLISPDSCATNAVSSPDVSACSTQTPHNTPQTGSPETPVYSVKNTVATGDVGVLESGLSSVVGGDIPSSPKLTATIDDSENNIACNKPPLTAASDVLDDNPAQTHINNQFEFATDTYILKSTGSVLEKTSMFEQQINSNQHQQQVSHNPTVRHENIYGHKGEDIYKSATLLAADRDSDRIDKETIEELNILIGELDLFQKEHELRLEEDSQPIQSLKNSLNYSNNSGKFSSANSESTGSERNDKISVSSSMNIDGMNMSLNSTNVGTEYLFHCSDSDIAKSEQFNSDSIEYPSTGFENPSFMHLNDSEIVVMRQNDFVNVDPENYYSQNMSEVVVLRCKDITNDSVRVDDASSIDSQQRLSSFKLNSSRSASPALSSFGVSRSPTPSFSVPPSSATTPTITSPQHISVRSNSSNNINNNNHVINHPQPQQQTLQQVFSNGNQKCSLMSIPSDERINRIKPAITPRPASLTGTSRVARRSSVNTVKPPPPVRRSSSVTPNPNLGTSSPNLVQQSIVYTSSESLPPPPAYLLDSNAGHSPGNVAGTVKALNEIRHKPASPSVLRRIPHNMPNQQQSSTLQHPINVLSSTLIPESSTALPYTSQFSPPNSASYSTTSGGSPNMSANRTSKSVHHQQGIYAQPKQITSMSSFRATSPGPQKQNSGLLAQLNARINPGKTQQQSSPQHYQSQQQQQSYTYTTAPSNESLFQRNQAEQRGTPNIANQQQPQASSLGIYSSAQHSQVQHQQQTSHYHYHQQQHHSTSKSSGNQRDDYQNRTNSGNASNTSNVLAKTSAGFLENLNARLAEQRLSGKAFAVRNLINSKALPDPRICHESLMDQIKRGATLKRNRTINDRSAPKIH